MIFEEDLHLPLLFTAYLIVVASPGPATMAIMGGAISGGRQTALTLVAGIYTGTILWAVTAATGIATMLTACGGAVHLLRVAGGLYLIFLAGRLARSALATAAPEAGPVQRGRSGGLFLRGLLLQLTNPKAGLSWIAVMSLGLRPDAGPETVRVIAAGCLLIALTVFLGYALVFSTPAVARLLYRLRRWIEAGLAALYACAGFGLLLVQR